MDQLQLCFHIVYEIEELRACILSSSSFSTYNPSQSSIRYVANTSLDIWLHSNTIELVFPPFQQAMLWRPAFMKLALSEARKGLLANEVPIGAVLVDPDGVVMSQAYNQKHSLQDPTAHAEISCIRNACTNFLKNWRLPLGCTLYTTVEPCAMCYGALVEARCSNVVFAANSKYYHGNRNLSELTSAYRKSCTIAFRYKPPDVHIRREQDVGIWRTVQNGER